MTPAIERTVELALNHYHDALRFYSADLSELAKGCVLRRQRAASLWDVRRALIEMGMYRVRRAPLHLPLAECD